MNREKTIEDFMDWNAIRGLTEKTLKAYKRIIVEFLSVTRGETRKDVARYIEYLKERNCKNGIEDKKIILKLWFKYLGKKEIYEEIKIKKHEIKLYTNELVTREDLEEILNKESNSGWNEMRGLRNCALFEFLYWTGCRVSEMTNLKMENVRETEYGFVFKVNGKTGEREVFVLNKNIRFLGRWIHKNESEWLIPSKRKDSPEGHLISKAVYDFVVRRGKMMGKRLYPHLFRHSAATRMTKEGYTEPILRRFFGWSKTSTMTTRYTHLAESDIMEIMLKKEEVVPGDPKTKVFNPLNADKIREMLQNPEVREIIKQEMEERPGDDPGMERRNEKSQESLINNIS